MRQASLMLLVAVTACQSNRPFATDPGAAVHTTRAPMNSMIFVARTDSAVVAIDLGWSGRPQALTDALTRIDARPADVRRVFLTHSHRDHIALWPWLQHARFHLAEAELPYFLGEREHRDRGSRAAELFHSTDLPRPGQLQIETFASDTSYVLGGDTLWAFGMPGHTEGSAAFVFRRTAFLGDAVSDDIRGTLRDPTSFFSEDVEQGRQSVRRFLDEIDARGLQVTWVCSAHATCNSLDELRKEFSLRPFMDP